ncbi:DUF1129 family protein [Bacillus sp. JCM 19041]|uniref:DUF1129 family protein n=1 Tax=Bacillus sp. JCM 19041 TaxID=1460637 RepID=UPI0006CFF942
MSLSKESLEFIEDLRAYLFASGKKKAESEEIIEELEMHLQEAEKAGKSIKQVVGDSPKEYMQSISEQLEQDKRNWIVFIPLIIMGGFSFTIVKDLFAGFLSYSLLEVVGYVGIVLLTLLLITKAVKKWGARAESGRKQVIGVGAATVIPLFLFIGLIFADRAIHTPMIHFGPMGMWIMGIGILLFVVGVSIWAKTWALPILLALVTLPEFLLRQTSLPEEAQLLTSTFIMLAGVLLYLFIINRNERKTEIKEH